MSKKKLVMLVVWVAVLAALGYASSRLSQINAPILPTVSVSPSNPSSEELNASTAKQNWTAIIKHAAAPPRGPLNAPYSMVEFGDFQCPQCGKMKPVIDKALASVPTAVDFYFVQRPIPQLHEHALAAAAAACSAAAQGKFWQMFDALYANQKDLRPDQYKEYADKAGINGDQVAKDVATNRYAAAVDESASFCDSINADSTPFVVLRDNRSGTVVTASGKTEIKALLARPPFITATAAAASAPAPKG